MWIHKIYWTIQTLKMHIFRKNITNHYYYEIHKIFVSVPTFLLDKCFFFFFLIISALSKSCALMRNLLVRVRSKFALINFAFFIPHSFLLTLFSSLKILIVQWWFSIKKTKNAQTTLCTSYLRRINTMFHAIWRSSFNTTSPVGKNTKITFVEECIFIKMVARADWFQNHYWIVNVISFKLCGTSQPHK